MLLKRKALQEMLKWKRSKGKQALLVTGARQVGKTFLIRQFMRENYESCVEINLLESEDALLAFASPKSPEGVFLRISAFARQELIPGKTAIFIDEVQESKEIVTALKFLVDRYGDDYDFIVSGSLLGVELQSVRSLPVGYLSIIEMYPLDFEEYCWAQGVSSLLIDEVASAYRDLRPVDDLVHNRLMDEFHHYLLSGGMPDAVSSLLQTHNMQEVRARQRDITDLYRLDISKYAGDRARTVRRIFDLIPAELNTQSKRFAFGHIEGESRFDRYNNDFMWLVDAGIAIPACNVDEPRYPLELSADSSYFKLFLCDVGLLTYLAGMDVVLDLLLDRTDINFGSIYENYVAQELVARGLCHPSPDCHVFFYRSRKLGELDFVFEDAEHRAVPLEVKSGKSYRRHSALSRTLEIENYGIERAIVLHEGNVEVDGKVAYLPMYMTMVLD